MNLYLSFRWFLILSFAFTEASAQFVSFEDSLVEAQPYRVKNLDEVDQYYLDQVNNQTLPVSQKRTFLRNYRSDLLFFKRTSGFGNTYFENEKAAYPFCMHSMIYGMGYNQPSFVSPAKAFMQEKAIYDIGSTLTDTVDFFPSFTLKGQVPKYFYFGQFSKVLDSTYLSKMRKGMGLWTFNGATPTDPYLRPNPFFEGNTGCWDCRCRNSWVDTRNTDNLKAMRETSVYLFAEEIANAQIRDLYFNRLRNHIGALWNVGYSEWDSETYVSHALGPFFNLFAFTRSVEAKKIGKAALDWYMLASSMKYFHGMSTGPSKRSNGSSNIRLGAGASDVPYLYFGDKEVPDNENFDRDRDSYITFLSGYNPPQAIRQLALKQFRVPVEMRNSKPPYGSFTPQFANKPDAFETMYYGKTYQMGSVVSSVAVNDMRPFKMGAFHPARGSDVFYVNTTDIDTLTHNKSAGDQIGQFENLMVFIHKNNTRKFFFQMPSDVPLDSVNGIWYFQYAKTWIALRPLGLNMESVQNLNGIYSQHKMYILSTLPGVLSGLAMEVADDDEYPSFDAFKSAVQSRPFSPNLLQDSSTIRIEGANGKFLKVKFNPSTELPIVYRNSSVPVDYSSPSNHHVYQSVTPPSCSIQNINYDGQNLALQTEAKDSLWGPVFENWKKGVLKILTNDQYFEGKFDSNTGEYYWKELPASDQLRKGKLALIQVYSGQNLLYSSSDSISINQTIQNMTFPFNQSGTFSFRLKVVDEEGNETWSDPVVYTVSSSPQIKRQSDVRIVPNPGSGIVRIETGNSLPCRFRVFTADGKELCEFIGSNGQIELNVSTWKIGLYFIRILSDSKEFTKPFVKE